MRMVSLTESVLLFSTLLSLVAALPERSAESSEGLTSPQESAQDYPYAAYGDGPWHYKDAGPAWKRAPAAAFYGMRGKKWPYYEGPGYQWLGRRDEKIDGRRDLEAQTLENLMGQKRAPAEGFMGLRGKRTRTARPAH